MNKYFSSKTQTRDAFRQIMLSSIIQIEKNIRHINDGTEFLHQLRVHIRKLYISMQLLAKLFPDILHNKQFVTFKQVVRLYESNLSKARDWDVFSQNTLPQIIAQLNTDTHYKNIQAQANAICLKTHNQMLNFINSKYQLWADLKTWLNLDNSMPNNDLSLKPIIQISDWFLIHKQKKLRSKLPPEQLSQDEQHKLRIFIKKYHYTLEFFAHLYKKKKVNPYLKNLKQMQDILGAIHDYIVMNQLCNKLLKQNSKSTSIHIMAIGKVIGYHACQVKQIASQFDKKWHKLCNLKSFYNPEICHV